MAEHPGAGSGEAMVCKSFHRMRLQATPQALIQALFPHLGGVEEEGAGDEHEGVASENAVPEAAHRLGDDQRHQGWLPAWRCQPLIHICDTDISSVLGQRY